MTQLVIDVLEASSPHLVETCVTLLFNAFAQPERYSLQRLRNELQNGSAPFYRKFFIAFEAGEIVGIGGVKAADWALHTHLLYLSAVAPTHRRQGIGRALVKARIEWIEQHFDSGRILVSSAKNKRFRELGFVQVPKSKIEGSQLLMRRF